MAMGSVVHLLFFLSEQCYLMPFSTNRIGTGLRANPVGGNHLRPPYGVAQRHSRCTPKTHFFWGALSCA
ncbi:hypothetical protein DV814_12825 [Shigella sonnei]|nr:hypothetical protein [Salmonella enterica subsp. enterica serovar Enteritidis]ECX4664472.1 hypothetical protein [Salmonella enterica]EDC0230064.1 hypothetical protein [Salmonella enterica subsp. enterica serovar Enteritidis]EGD4474515.1 hypothetical protein [Shigella sonnei]